jgi:hypothetical protein
VLHRGCRTASVGFPWLDVSACQLGASGVQRGAGVFAGDSRRKAAVRNVGRGRPGYLASNSG